MSLRNSQGKQALSKNLLQTLLEDGSLIGGDVREKGFEDDRNQMLAMTVAR